MTTSTAKFFKKNGKALIRPSKRSSTEYITGLGGLITETEELFSLADSKQYKVEPASKKLLNTIGKISVIFNKKILYFKPYVNLLKQQAISFPKLIKAYNLRKWKYHWIAGSTGAFVLGAALLVMTPNYIKPDISNKYSIYSSMPLTMSYTEYEVYTKDSRAQRINEVFRQFNCPLEGLGEAFVYEADKNNIPWWLVASVSFQESSCGKKTPEPGGLESYNAWGWGVYGENTHSFDNWVRGIETVSKYMSSRFYSKGVTEPCDIMKTYTPPSQGSWCEGVKYFGEMIESYKTPTKEEIAALD